MSRQILGKVMVVTKGEYSSMIAYEKLDLVSFNGSSYICKKDCTNIPVENNSYWQLVAAKGDTYQVTEEDIQAIANEIVNDANSSFNQNVDTKTKEFNENVTAKTTDFDTNANSKTSAFNSNSDTKLKAYNDNDAAKTTAFNTNVDNKTNSYNTNAQTKQQEYDTNADNQLRIFNENAESYDTRISEVSSRLYRVEQDLFDSGAATGKSINIKDSALAEFKSIRISAIHKQTTTQGKQLFNINDVAEKDSVFTIDEDDWITVTCDNSSGTTIKYFNYFTNLLDLQLGTQYNAILEVKSVQGGGIVWTVSGTASQFAVGYASNFEDLSNNVIKQKIVTTKTDFTDCMYSIRSFVQFNAGQSGSITFRISLLEDITVTPDNFVYEKFTGRKPSPNPDYPQPIEVIEEDFDLVTYDGKQLFNINDVASVTSGVTVDEDGWITVTYDNLEGTTYRYFNYFTNLLDLSVGTQYNAILEVKSVQGSGYVWVVATHNVCQFVSSYSLNFKDLSNNVIKQTIVTTKTDFTNCKYSLRSCVSFAPGQSGSITFRISLLEDITITPDNFVYVPYQESRQKITMPVGEFAGKINESFRDIFRLGFNEEDSNYHLYLDKFVGRCVLDGTQAISGLKAYGDNIRFSIMPENYQNEIYYQGSTLNAMCDTFEVNYEKVISSQVLTTTTPAIYCHSSAILIMITPDMNLSSKDDLNNFLANHNTTIYYSLVYPKTLDLGIVNMPLSYYPVTNVFTTHELQPEIKVEYYRDFKTTIVAMQNNQTSMQETINSHSNKILALEAAINNMQTSSTNLEESEVLNNDLQVE